MGLDFRPLFLLLFWPDQLSTVSDRHQVGDRPYVIAEYGKPYIAERGEFIKVLTAPGDFELRHVVEYPVTGGLYRVDFSQGAPTVDFVPGKP